MSMTVSVIVPTYNRPDCVRRCIECLLEQTPQPDQIIIVDASPDTRTRDAVAEYPGVVYLFNESGRGNTPNSRNAALEIAFGEIIAFLDDDAYVMSGWLPNMVETFESDPKIGGVAGRALRLQPGEENIGKDRIGLLTANGILTGNFAAEPGKWVEVDHMIGCNMALRGDIIATLGGFKDDDHIGPYCICEETEICLRAKRLGYRLVFNPAVCAEHVGAVKPAGPRFNMAYIFWHCRNNLVMLFRNYGLGIIVWRHIGFMIVKCFGSCLKRIWHALVHLGSEYLGLMAGFFAGIYLLLKTGAKPERNDAKGRRIREAMQRNRRVAARPAASEPAELTAGPAREA